MRIRRLLPDDGCDDATNAADINFDGVAHRFCCGVSNRERILAEMRNLEFHEPRLGGSDEHRENSFRRLGIDVAEQGGNHPISKIGRQLEAVGDRFFLTVVIRVSDGDLPMETFKDMSMARLNAGPFWTKW